MNITADEFALLQTLIHRESGIYLSPAKQALLVSRLARRLRTLGIDSFLRYYHRILEDREERMHMLDRVCTNETHFFREPNHFEFLEKVVFPRWRARPPERRRLRIWSAACSTGQEPYSLAMTLLSNFSPEEWDIEIIASDLSSEALATARAGIWPIERAAEIPSPLLHAFMLKGCGAQEGRMKAGPELRAILRFARINLNEARYPLTGPFDLIFCRNVLIYFEQAGRTRVVEQLTQYLAADGYLFVGHAESLHRLSGLACVTPTVYARRAA